MTRRIDGARVAVLRVGDGSDAIAEELRARGAIAATVRVATVEDRPDDDVRAEVGELERYAWAAVTSANGARRLALWAAHWPASVRIGVVGPATARAVEEIGLRADAVAPRGTAASLAETIDVGPVVFLAARDARDDLVAGLSARGIEVDTVVAYATVPEVLDAADVDTIVRCDVLVVTSPSCVDAIYAVPVLRDVLEQRPLVTIGPTTSQHARGRGLRVAATAAARDGASVADAVVLATRDGTNG